MSGTVLHCGFVPLLDCAPLIVARDMGFAADEGLEIDLLKQPSWAALRDLLALGHLDAAHMLAPMPLAMSLGISGTKTQVDAPLVMSANGTVIGVSRALAHDMRATGWDADGQDPVAFVTALLHVTSSTVRVGVPFPFSMHRLLFEYLLAGAGQAAHPRIELITMPPQLMSSAVASGDVDVFCVGEPWGTVAVTSGAGELVLPGSGIWQHAPEKVLGMRRAWAAEHPQTASALLRAVYRACAWLGTPANQPLATELLARSEHLNLADHTIDAGLMGLISPRMGAEPWQIPTFLKFHAGACNFPWRSVGAWIGAQVAGLEGLDVDETVSAGAQVMRADLFRRALDPMGADLPGASAKKEGAVRNPMAVASTRGGLILDPDAFFDGKTFDFDPNN